jgi:hypothetical protein
VFLVFTISYLLVVELLELFVEELPVPVPVPVLVLFWLLWLELPLA